MAQALPLADILHILPKLGLSLRFRQGASLSKMALIFENFIAKTVRTMSEVPSASRILRDHRATISKLSCSTGPHLG